MTGPRLPSALVDQIYVHIEKKSAKLTADVEPAEHEIGLRPEELGRKFLDAKPSRVHTTIQ